MNLSSFFRTTFSSLYHRDFRYFWFGQALSTIGSMIQVTALSWYIYQISGSALLLGLMGVFEFGPVMALALFSGVVVDRFPKKRILFFTQSAFLVQSLLLSFLVWKGSHNYWLFAILALVAGIANSLDQPTRQSYFVELVGKKDLPNAISLNSTSFNLARILGPAIAGLIMSSLGVAICFLINGLSFIPVIYGIALIKITGNPKTEHSGKKVFSEIAKGVSYVFKNAKILPAFLILMMVCTFSMNVNVVLPVFAKHVLLGNENTYSFMMSMLGLGSLCGALFMAGKGRNIKSKYFLVTTALAIGILQMMALLGQTSLVYMCILLVCVGFLSLCFLNRANSRIQLNISDDYRGRVMSIYVLVTTGSTPIGNTLTGWAMDAFGEKYGFFFDGAISFILVLILFIIYKKYFEKAKVVPDTDAEKQKMVDPIGGNYKS